MDVRIFHTDSVVLDYVEVSKHAYVDINPTTIRILLNDNGIGFIFWRPEDIKTLQRACYL